jgi:hypothetical protein
MTADPRTLELLLVTAPLLKLMRGARGVNFRRAWLAAAHGDAPVVPSSAPSPALAVFDAALDLCAAAGIARIELIERFNDRGEEGMAKPDFAEALESLFKAALELYPTPTERAA